MTYMYRCQSCGKEFDEARAVVNRNALGSCPVCLSAARRVFTVPQLTTNPLYLRDENRVEYTPDERRGDDHAYEQAWKPEPVEGPLETVGSRRR